MDNEWHNQAGSELQGPAQYALCRIYNIIIIISLTSIFFQDKSRVWTAASQQH